MPHTPDTTARRGPRRRQFVQASLAGAAALAAPGLAQAQAFPSRPLKLICPWPAGGSTDIVMRALAESATKALGQQVVIENKAGASGMLGPNDLVNARPDGYTLSQLTIGVLRLPHMQKMQFDPMKDFTYIVCLTGYTFGMVVKADSPFKTVKDVVDYGPRQPGQIQLRLHRQWHHAAPGGGGICVQGQHPAAARALPRQCRRHAGAAGRPCDGAQRCHRLGPACGRRHLPPAGHLRQQAHQALGQRAHAAGTGL